MYVQSQGVAHLAKACSKLSKIFIADYIWHYTGKLYPLISYLGRCRGTPPQQPIVHLLSVDVRSHTNLHTQPPYLSAGLMCMYIALSI